jgi:hypothetical protein
VEQQDVPKEEAAVIYVYIGELEDRYEDRLSFVDFLIGEMLQNVLMTMIFPRFILLLCVHMSAGVG